MTYLDRIRVVTEMMFDMLCQNGYRLGDRERFNDRLTLAMWCLLGQIQVGSMEEVLQDLAVSFMDHGLPHLIQVKPAKTTSHKVREKVETYLLSTLRTQILTNQAKYVARTKLAG